MQYHTTCLLTCLPALFAAVAWGQNVDPARQQPGVRVIVTEDASGTGLADVKLSLIAPGISGTMAQCTSDPSGECRFQGLSKGNYLVLANKPGFGESSRSILIGDTEQTTYLRLARPGRLRGSVVDSETGLGIPALAVGARKVRYVRGRRSARGILIRATTDRQGDFVLEGLQSGEYVLELWQVEKASDTGMSRSGYGRRVWPGGGDVESSSPLHVPAGSDQYVGRVQLPRSQLHSVALRIDKDVCAGRRMRLELRRSERIADSIIHQTDLVCGGSASFSGVVAGLYDLRAFPTDVAVPDIFGHDSIAVTDRDIERVVALHFATPVTGKVVVETPAAPGEGGNVSRLPAGLAVKLWPQGEDSHREISIFPTLAPAKVAEDGSFGSKIYIPPTGLIQVIPFGIPEGFYLKGVRYNGHLSVGRSLMVEQFAAVLDIEVVLSPMSAAVAGAISGCESCPARVLVAPSPLESVDQFPTGVLEVASRNGRFSIGRLAPGKYRIIAVPDEDDDDDRLDQPGRLLGLFYSGSEVVVAAGNKSEIKLELVTSY